MYNVHDNALYLTAPLAWEQGIPIFSKADVYTENYKKIANDHLDSMNKGDANPFIGDALWRELEASTRALVNQYIAPNSTVLDVGVGLGRVLENYNQLKRYGMDISLDYLEQSKQKGFDVCYAKIEDMPYRDMFFDAVVCCDVLEHVIDLHRCCQQITRVIKQGGTLIIRVPYKDDMEAYLSDNIPYEFVHLRSFDVPSLRLLFEKIYGCSYVTHALVAPHFKGAQTLNLRTLWIDDPFRKQLNDISEPKPQLDILRHMMVYSQEEINNAIGLIRDEYPALYATLLPHLVQPLEMNLVFKKK